MNFITESMKKVWTLSRSLIRSALFQITCHYMYIYIYLLLSIYFSSFCPCQDHATLKSCNLEFGGGYYQCLIGSCLCMCCYYFPSKFTGRVYSTPVCPSTQMHCFCFWCVYWDKLVCSKHQFLQCIRI